MRTVKEIIADTKQFAKENKRKSWWLTLSTLFLILLAWIGTYWNFHFAAKIVCSVLLSLLIARMFMIYHDYQHKAVLLKSKAGNILMTIFGIAILTPPSIWKRSHDHHHKNNSKLFGANIGSFPIMTKQKFLSATKMERFRYLSIRHPLTILNGYVSVFIFGMCIRSFIKAPEKHYDSIIALVLHFTIGFLLFWFLGVQTLLLSLIIPFFFTFAIGSYLFYAQHNFPTVKFRNSVEWSYEHAALESSSYMKMNKVMEWFLGNIGYHHIHHFNAHIPFYRLPEAMRKIPELQLAKTTSLNPVEVFRCLRLKIWDPEKDRMISLKELQESKY